MLKCLFQQCSKIYKPFTNNKLRQQNKTKLTTAEFFSSQNVPYTSKKCRKYVL